MKRNRMTLLAVLMAVLLCANVLAWEPAGYSPDFAAQLRAVCYDPAQIIANPGWNASRVFAYSWQEPQANAQKFVFDLAGQSFTLSTAGAVQAEFTSKTLGQWLQGMGRTLTGNPYANGIAARDYYNAAVDRAAYRAKLLAKNSTGYDMTDPVIAAAVQRRTDTNMAVYFGQGSGFIRDENGIVVRNGYGAPIDPAVPTWWIKPADCNGTVPPTATPTPPGPTPTAAPSAGMKCKNPATGLCETPPGIFGGGCPAGWVQCGTPPPVVTPIPPVVTPIPGATVACLSADGRYSRVATACAADETPLRK